MCIRGKKGAIKLFNELLLFNLFDNLVIKKAKGNEKMYHLMCSRYLIIVYLIEKMKKYLFLYITSIFLKRFNVRVV